MQLEEALETLEESLNKLENFIINLKKENSFLIEELEKDERIIENYRKGKEITIQTLNLIKDIIKKNTFEIREEPKTGIKIKMINEE